MTTVQTIEFKNYTALIDALDQRTMALEAFTWMLEMCLEQGDDMQFAARGVSCLLSLHTREMNFLAGALMSEYRELEASKLELRDLDKLAEWANVPPHVAKRVVEIATGIKLSGAPTPTQPSSPFNQVFGETVAPANTRQDPVQ